MGNQPHVPEENRNPFEDDSKSTRKAPNEPPRDRTDNSDKRGQQANIKQNTTNPGQQQDR